MAIYRTLYYADVTVGVGGRVTIPQDMREDLGIDEGDSLTVRVEENPRGGRQMVIWRAEEQPDEEEKRAQLLTRSPDRPTAPGLPEASPRRDATTGGGMVPH